MTFDYMHMLEEWRSNAALAQRIVTALRDRLGDEMVGAHAAEAVESLMARSGAASDAGASDEPSFIARRIGSVLDDVLNGETLSGPAAQMATRALDDQADGVGIPEHLSELVACMSAIAHDGCAPHGEGSVVDVYPRPGDLLARIEESTGYTSVDSVSADIAVGLVALSSEGVPDCFPAVKEALDHLAPGGVACLLLPNDFMWALRRDAVAAKQALVEAGTLECVVGLPTRVVPGTSTNVCLAILRAPQDDANGQGERGVLFIDARSLAERDEQTQRATLDARAIAAICEAYTAWRAGSSPRVIEERPCTVASPARIARNRYLLTPELYTRQDRGTGTSLSALVELGRQIAALDGDDAAACARAVDELAAVLEGLVDETGVADFPRRTLGDFIAPVSPDTEAGQNGVDAKGPFIVADMTALHQAAGDSIAVRIEDDPDARSGQAVFAVKGDLPVAYLARVMRHTSSEDLLVDAYGPNRHIDVEALLTSRFVCPPAKVACTMESAFEKCEALDAQLRIEEASVLEKADRAYRDAWERGTERVALSSVAMPRTGKDLPFAQRGAGEVPVLSAFGEAGTTDVPLSNGRTVVVGARGTLASLLWSTEPCWPTGGTVFIDPDSSDIAPEHLYFSLRAWMDTAGPVKVNGRDGLRDVVEKAEVVSYSESLEGLARTALAARASLVARRALVSQVVEQHLVPIALGGA